VIFIVEFFSFGVVFFTINVFASSLCVYIVFCLCLILMMQFLHYGPYKLHYRRIIFCTKKVDMLANGDTPISLIDFALGKYNCT
jgi:hypothetical protein